MAALDWGASYGAVGPETVVALEPVQLAALDWELVGRLMADAPGFSSMVERAARARLAAL